MPADEASVSDPAIAGPLGGLLLSAVRARSPMLVLRAVHWWRDLSRLGVNVPLFVAHDVGLLYGAPREQVGIGSRTGSGEAAARVPGLPGLLGAYHALIAEVAEGQAAWGSRAPKFGDDLVIVLLARVFAPLFARPQAAPPWPVTLPLDPKLIDDLDGRLPQLFAAAPRASDEAAIDLLIRARLRLLTRLDTLHPDALRFVAQLGARSVGVGALGQVDLLAALSKPITNDVAHFSLELLPKVLETYRARAPGAHAVHGYRGVGKRGSIDSMVLTEVAWDDEELARRVLDGEILFFTRERAPEESRRLHHLVIDASASMRGDREVFARGLAIALAKRLELDGEEVRVRFFDSRLYEVRRSAGLGRDLPLAWLVGFNGERGRNPARVFTQLATELALVRARDHRQPIVHLITHAALHVPRQLVEEIRKHAGLFGVFILPSGGSLDLEWLDLLEGHAVVDHATLGQHDAREAAATRIVDEAARICLD